MAGKTAGRSGSKWRHLRKQIAATQPPCYHCGQPINYTATYPEPDSYTLDHLKPRSRHPELAEDPANLVPSHARCNAVKGARYEQKPGLGNKSEKW